MLPVFARAVPLLLLLAAVQVWGLDPHSLLTQYAHESWTREQDIPSNTIDVILQSRDGYLWIGSREGLVRYDGTRFRIFDTRNSSGLSDNNIFSLAEDKDGTLWVGTQSGLHRFRNNKFTRVTEADGFHSTLIRTLLVDSRGVVWIGSDRDGLTSYEGHKYTTYTVADGLPSNFVRALCQDPDGGIWIGGPGGLAHLANGKFTTHGNEVGLDEKGAQILSMSKDGTLWIGTLLEGMFRYRNGSFQEFTFPDVQKHRIESLLVDRDQNLWIGTNETGLFRYNGSKLDRMSVSEGLTDHTILSLHEDREGSLWIGTFGGRLNRLRNSVVTAFSRTEGLPGDVLYSVFPDPQGNVWLGFAGDGVAVLNANQIRTYSKSDGLAGQSAFCFWKDPDGTLWIGTYGSGLSSLKDGVFHNYDTKDGLTRNYVRAILRDRRGTLWVGTGYTLNEMVGQRFVSHPAEGGDPSLNQIHTMFEDRDGDIWIGTAGGLLRMREGQFRAYTAKDGLSQVPIRTIHQDPQGTLWLGTEGSGIVRFRNNTFRSITVKQGLYDENIFKIVADDLGYFWMSCNRGIFRASALELNEAADGKRPGLNLLVFTQQDGMKSSECNAGYPAGGKAPDGTIWFPTMKGAVMIDPRRVSTKSISVPVLIEQFLVDSRELSAVPTPVLPAGSRNLEIQYTAPYLANPSRIQFRYRLRGLEQEWVEAGARRTAYFSHIPPGDYVFEVFSSGPDGTWTSNVATLAFRLQPFFYQTYWFFGLCAILAIAAGLGIHRFRVYALHARQAELSQMVQERTIGLQHQEEVARRAMAMAEDASTAKSQFLANMSHELRTPLNAIIGYSEILQDEANDVKQLQMMPDLKKIQGAGRHLLSLINDILDLSKIEAGKLDLIPETFRLSELIEDVISMTAPLIEKKKNRLVAEFPKGNEQMYADPVRVRQILFNLISNAAKFTENGIVRLEVHREDKDSSRWYRMSVTDTGIGMTPEQLSRLFQPFEQAEASVERKYGGTGLGLVISKKFCQMMGGDIAVQSEYGKGTTFTVNLPAGQS